MLPSVIAHADWGVNIKKRIVATAIHAGNGAYRVMGVEPVQQNLPFFRYLKSLGEQPGPVLAGFDFPIGAPSHYAELAGIEDFLSWLGGLGKGEWADFYRVAERPEQISLQRPFYPQRGNPAAGVRRVKQRHLLEALHAEHADQLRRLCEQATPQRRAACPLFWTVGAQQVGKAALSGWKEVLAPELADPSIRLKVWPFSGRLAELLASENTIAVETYPAEFYHQLGIRFNRPQRGEKSGKRVQAERARNASTLLSCAVETGLGLEGDLEEEIQAGFGSSADGEDRFDALVGLLGMLKTLRQLDVFPEPEDQELQKIEGWIFGQALTTATRG